MNSRTLDTLVSLAMTGLTALQSPVVPQQGDEHILDYNQLSQPSASYVSPRSVTVYVLYEDPLVDLIASYQGPLDNAVVAQHNDNSEVPSLEELLDQNNVLEVPDLGFTQDGRQILGLYTPHNDQSYVVDWLPEYQKDWVKAHEEEHRRRNYAGMSQSEAEVDMAASRTLGYYPFNDGTPTSWLFPRYAA